jgi:cysteinyl-tRNA synthetase
MATPIDPSAISLHNTLRRGAAPLKLREPGKVSVYWCGPTTYDVAHVGHARSAIAFDLLVRVLRAAGLEVHSVRNVTDVDDKILARAKEAGEEPTTLSARMAALYQEDMAALGCEAPTVEPRVSAHIPQILGLVESLVAKGSAYVVAGESPDAGKDVYFRVRAFDGYGKLSGRKLDELESGSRIEVDARKEDPLDFALWKGCANDAWGWDSPWGKGRPGWHIECSAMSAEYLGHGMDIHGGGMDLIFPHHENEIAQSEAAHPGEGDFATCWMHNGFVNVDKEKMSKSLGNFVTVRDVLARNDAEALRLFLVSQYYRGPVSFDVEKLEGGRVVFPAIDEAERKVDYLYTTLARVDAMTVAATPGELTGDYAKASKELDALRKEAFDALADDLNAARTVAALYRIAAVINEMADLHVRKKGDRAPIARVIGKGAHVLREIADVLGVLRTPANRYRERSRERRLRVLGLDAAKIEGLVKARNDARAAKDWAAADAIRAELTQLGIEIYDGTGGTGWEVKI